MNQHADNMNLYIFNETRLGVIYGVGTYLRELSSALKSSDINVCMINLTSEKPHIKMEEIDGIRYWHFPSPVQWKARNEEQWDFYHRNIVYLLQLHIKDKKNLIFHLNNNKKNKLAEELKKKFDCKIVLTIHFLEWRLKPSDNLSHSTKTLESQQSLQIKKGIKDLKEEVQREKEIFKVVDHIICLSEKTLLILQEDYKINPEKITLIHNGLADNKSFIIKPTLKQKYYVPDIPIILFVGRLDEGKGLSYALRAFKIVLKAHPDCRFIIVGKGAFDLRLKECEDIWMNVTWTGLLSKEKLYELYAIADIGIVPSFHEQCSYVAIEMMMHGLPIIGTSTGMSEMVDNYMTGFHIPVIKHTNRIEIDSSLFAEKIVYLLQHPTEAKQMGQNGRKRYLCNYSSEIFRSNMLQLYKSL